MPVRELFLLSPYTLPTRHPLMLGADDSAAWLNGYLTLWHPAALAHAAGPPRVSVAYDHEPPKADHLYAVPESPPLMLPEDWDERVRASGAAAFRATPDRAETLANLRDALKQLGDDPGPLDADPARMVPFFGLGWGYIIVETLFDAMEHEHLLDADGFWQDVRAALTVPNAAADAAAKLLAAREILYPATIHLLDLALLDEKRPDAPLPASFAQRSPFNLVASAAVLEELARAHPDRLAALRDPERAIVELCGGSYREREDALLPLESQWWNLRRGLAVTRQLTGADVQVFARRRTAFHPQTPQLLHQVGLTKLLDLAFDSARIPSHKATLVQWPAADGRQVNAYTRTPYPGDDAQTFFHMVHYLHQTIMQDSAATLCFRHGATPAGPWYEDWLALNRLAPVLGQWETFSTYLRDAMAGEYALPAAADDFTMDYLEERTDAGHPHPVSGFAEYCRRRRRLDTALTLAALRHALGGGDADLHRQLTDAEDRGEANPDEPSAELEAVEGPAARQLADRLLTGAPTGRPGLMVLNPCSFTRRVALERDDITGPLTPGGPVKAAQFDGGTARLVVEVPGLGFAWVPRNLEAARASGALNPSGRPAKIKLADANGVRNEFFEAEIDPATGGLRALRDARDRASRIGQQLIFQPGSIMKATDVRVTSSGLALGEVVASGELLDDQQRVLATFRQRFRAWLGRPLLEMQIALTPQHRPHGYAWHAYYGARFAWRDEHATLVRGVNGTPSATTHTRPMTPDYLELRSGKLSTLILPGGLPFHQRHGPRMLDVVLVPQGETATTFDLALGLDRDYPMQTALGWTTPAVAVPVEQGPPHVGPSGWLFHLDAPNLALLSLRPAEGSAVEAHLLECGSYGGQAELRCARDPTRAVKIETGQESFELSITGDAVQLDVAANELVQIRVEF